MHVRLRGRAVGAIAFAASCRDNPVGAMGVAHPRTHCLEGGCRPGVERGVGPSRPDPSRRENRLQPETCNDVRYLLACLSPRDTPGTHSLSFPGPRGRLKAGEPRVLHPSCAVRPGACSAAAPWHGPARPKGGPRRGNWPIWPRRIACPTGPKAASIRFARACHGHNDPSKCKRLREARAHPSLTRPSPDVRAPCSADRVGASEALRSGTQACTAAQREALASNSKLNCSL